jgi:hypothetical protein
MIILAVSQRELDRLGQSLNICLSPFDPDAQDRNLILQFHAVARADRKASVKHGRPFTAMQTSISDDEQTV